MTWERTGVVNEDEKDLEGATQLHIYAEGKPQQDLEGATQLQISTDKAHPKQPDQNIDSFAVVDMRIPKGKDAVEGKREFEPRALRTSVTLPPTLADDNSAPTAKADGITKGDRVGYEGKSGTLALVNADDDSVTLVEATPSKSWENMTKNDQFQLLSSKAPQVDYKTFTNGMAEYRGEEGGDILVEFEDLDENGNGFISLQEYTTSKAYKAAEGFTRTRSTPNPTIKPTARPTIKATPSPTAPTPRPTPRPAPRALKQFDWLDAPSFPVQHSADLSAIHSHGPQILKHHRIFGPYWPPRNRDYESATEMATRLFWHTASVATHVLDDGTSFVFTGDIDDLWLRDSAAQVHPYIVYLKSGKDRELERMVSGLILRCAFYINYDPYANAFREDTSYVFSEEQKTKLGRYGYIATYDYELDSGCYFIRMLFTFCEARPENQVCQSPVVIEAVRTMVDVWIAEQRHEDRKAATGWLPYVYQQLTRFGKGPETAYTGMTWTASRPSDDVSKFSYLVPSNAFAVVALGYVAKLAKQWETAGAIPAGDTLAKKATRLEMQIQDGIEKFGITDHPKYGKIYAYEVDGLGNQNLMDDANVPSLLSLPYLGYKYDPEVYKNTRKFLLSADNPYYHCSSDQKVCGIGSPHTEGGGGGNVQHGIWPMAQLMQGLTSTDEAEKLEMLQQVMHNDGRMGWMHESYSSDNSNKFTRPWFCWVDSLFAELAMSLAPEVPSWKPESWFSHANSKCKKKGCHLELAEESVWKAGLEKMERKHRRGPAAP
jgi:meiotically up-regulated gene 157 (Mug157) protein